MTSGTFTRSLVTIALALGGAAPALAQYPDKPIRFVVPFSAGSSTDLLARAIGIGITRQTQQPVVVENRAGANSFLGAQEVARSPGDGYTVLITTNSTHAANEHLFKKLPYDPVKDFTPLTALSKGDLVMVVDPQGPYKSVADLTAAAKKGPGKLSFGSGTSSSRVASELYKSMAGVFITNIPYKSNPPGLQDLIGGQLDMMMADTPTALPLIKTGRLRPLAVSGKTRSALAPDVPTMDEAGVKGYEMSYWFAAYAPANLPPAIQTRLNELIINAVKQKAVQDLYAAGGLETYVTTPAGLAAFQAAESKKWAQVIRAANIERE
ncbi:Bug family tripartite tricarboxylate transporter substrate binding protein [Variovorax ginsengisoli]|uniref:Tripartite tricarboxylate transporter substrate binding protein n=1 Tax=Variovorax ginsengisoli TaxID=363844 RepID=A0ABT8SEK7_9BURK|nr:tripartite tricarboxylate transporter substrate binding protein [Variovorax ginsengisoli]MDN8618191.1 tripartite tricarboxylate transporter substrate binding protein [Variovorax ginsengisoli]MDO1537361.1 tripartite tricarboxylate transporter substrate binding protein [Variovorax ginsengisoli]